MLNINNISQKQVIKLLIIVSGSLDTVKKIKFEDGSITYRGFLWDIWKELKEDLKKKYDFKIFFSDNDNSTTNYDKITKLLYKGEYDIVLGSFYHTLKRERLINFTSILLIDKTTILHYPKTNFWKRLNYIVIKNTKPVSFLIIIGFILGFILSYINKTSEPKTIKYFLNLIMTVIFTMFGQTESITDKVSLSLPTISIIIIVLITSFILIMYIQAKITSNMIREPAGEITRQNIYKQNLIGYKGDASVYYVKKLNPKSIKEFEFKSNSSNELIDIYLKNSNIYDGMIISKTEANYYLKKYPKLISSDNFGSNPVSFIVNQTKTNLLNDLNLGILKLRSNLSLQRICLSYFGRKSINTLCSIN